jgi:hypothetical protein
MQRDLAHLLLAHLDVSLEQLLRQIAVPCRDRIEDACVFLIGRCDT